MFSSFLLHREKPMINQLTSLRQRNPGVASMMQPLWQAPTTVLCIMSLRYLPESLILTLSYETRKIFQCKHTLRALNAPLVSPVPGRQPRPPPGVCLRSSQGLFLEEEPDTLPGDCLWGSKVNICNVYDATRWYSLTVLAVAFQECYLTILIYHFLRKQENLQPGMLEKDQGKDIRMWVDPQRRSIHSLKWSTGEI